MYLRFWLFTCILLGNVPLFGQNPSEEIGEELSEMEAVEDVAYYSPWRNYSQAGFWVVPLATPFLYSPYDHLRYQPPGSTGRRGATLAEWAYVNQAGVNVGVTTPDGFQVVADTSGLVGLKRKRSPRFIIPPQYRQLEYMTRDLLAGWIQDSLDIWTTSGEQVNRIKYGFREGQPPRFSINLPAIQRGGNELTLGGKGGMEDLGYLGFPGPYSRDSDFLAPRQRRYIDRFKQQEDYIGLFRVENKSAVKVRAEKSFIQVNQSDIQLPQRDSSLVDSLYVMLVRYGESYQVLASQGRQLFRLLPFTFPTKGKTQGRFKGNHMGRVGPLYPSIYYEYDRPILTLKEDQIKLEIRFTERYVYSSDQRTYTYTLTGTWSDYNERLNLVSSRYVSRTSTPLYQYQHGLSASLINVYGNEVIPAGTYRNFMVCKQGSMMAETMEGKVELLYPNGKPMDKATFMRLNKLSVKSGLQVARGGPGRGGMLYRDSLDFVGPFLPTYQIIFIDKENISPVFVDQDEDHSLLFDVAQNRVTDTLAGSIVKPQSYYSQYIPFSQGGKKGYYSSQFELMIPPQYDDLYLNTDHEYKVMHVSYRKDSTYGILDTTGRVVAGPVVGSRPKMVWGRKMYLQKKLGRVIPLDRQWKPITNQRISKFPINNWGIISNDLQLLPFQTDGKYGILSLSGEVIEPPVNDSLRLGLTYGGYGYGMKFFAVGNDGSYKLADALNAFIYPEVYQNIYSYFDYKQKNNWDNAYFQQATKRFNTGIIAVLERKDGEVMVLLGNGKIVKLEALQ